MNRPSTQRESDDVDTFYSRLQAKQNLPLGVVAGFVAATVCSLLWMLIAFTLHIESSAIAMLIGVATGQSVRFFGRGVTIAFPVAAAVLAVYSCLLGKLLAASAFIAAHQDVDCGRVLLRFLSNLYVAFDVLVKMTRPLDVVFYLVAVLTATKLAFRLPAVFNES